MTKSNVILTSIFLLLIVSCSVQKSVPVDEGMKTWMGATKHELILAWGPPAKVDSDGNGGEILTYYWVFQSAGSVTSITTDDYVQVRQTSPSTRISEANMYFDSDGKFYHYKTNFTKLWVTNMNPKSQTNK